MRLHLGWAARSVFQRQEIPLEQLTYWGRRARLAQTPIARGFWKGVQWGAEDALLFGMPAIALQVGMAQRGEMLPTALASSAELLTYPAFSGLVTAGLSALFPGMPAVGFIGGMLAMYPDALVQDNLTRGIRTLTDEAQRLRRLEMGGRYQDTALAQQQRTLTLQELSGAMGASRRYLGQEAALMHR